MANSTYYQTVNTCLRRAGQAEIASTSVFDSGTLSKIQRQAKQFVDEANRWLMLDTPAQFLLRDGSCTIDNGSGGAPSVSNNNTGFSIGCFNEQVIPKSVFITTSSKGRELQPMDFIQWRRMDPDGHTATGTPTHYVQIPQSSVGQTADKWSFYPVPAAVLTVKFNYYSDPLILTTSTDTIVWPPRLEAILWDMAGAYLEIVLGEGKVPEFGSFIMPHLTKIRQMTLGLDAIPTHVMMGLKIGGIKRGRRSAYSPD